jgi:dihydrofolate synthase/folylpolyglutamate synthase
MTPYADVLKYIFTANTQRNAKIDLSRMEKLAAYFGNPEHHFRSIHIAGTNGKGSTATKIAAGFRSAGFRTALFTSPHISTFRERIQINGELIPEDAVSMLFSDIMKAQNQFGLKATFFEITTLISFLYSRDQNIDWAVYETGLGGRLDPTNVLHPELSIITSIAADHTEILGNTLEAIAKEKAGIIKPRTPVLIGPRVLFAPIAEAAHKKRCPILAVEGAFPTFDEENNAIARRAMECLALPAQAIDAALPARPPCRMEEVYSSLLPYPVLLDVAHNPDGLQALFRSLPEKYRNPSVILGLSTSKDIPHCLRIAAKEAQALYFVKADTPRAAPLELLAKKASELNCVSYQCCSSLMQALTAAKPPIVVCGTFFIMSAARTALGLTYTTDPVS